MKFSKIVLSFLLVFACVFTAQQALGQAATGRVVGTVTDEQGKAVAGAKVSVINVDTTVAYPSETNAEGYYDVPSVPIGVYKVSVEHTGFKIAISQERKLQINETARFDITLSVGATNETVVVEATISGVETVNPTVGESVTDKPIVDLPLNGRNVLDLALLQPGVTPGNNGGFSISGGRTDATTYILDGGLNTNLLNNAVVYNPNPDTIQEFRILTSTYTAEYGRNAGGVISVVTKSGTNQLHGSAYDYARNDAFNARSFQANFRNQAKDILKRHQFGGTLGGPVTIPGVVHGRDRLFFFASYQGQRQTAGDSRTGVRTFTPAMLNGDFSHAGNLGSSASAADPTGPNPFVACFLSGLNHNNKNAADSTSCGIPAHPQFQADAAKAFNGIIDPAKFDPIAQKYIALGVIPTSTTGLFSSAAATKDDSNEITGKIDWAISQADKLTVSVGGNRQNLFLPYGGGRSANVPGFDNTTTNHQYFGNVAWVRTVSPYALNEFRFTAQRRFRLQGQPVEKLPSPVDLGIKINPDRPVGPPRLTFSRAIALGFRTNGPTTFPDNTYNYSDVFTWNRGNHTWKFGGSFTAYQDNLRFAFESSGVFGFSRSGDNSLGNTFADFLVGNPSFFEQGPDAPNNVRTKTTVGFAQDEWRVLRNLTLTLGLRYEYSTPKLDTLGRTDVIIPGLQSTRFASAPTGIVFPFDKGAPRGLYFPDKNDFAPRVGFAWDPWSNHKTSIRGGFGIFYDVINGSDNIDQNGAQPFASFSSFTFNQLPDYTKPFSPFQDPFGNSGGIINPFPTPPASANPNWTTVGFVPFGATSDDPHVRTPYVYQYSLGLQREVAKGLLAQASYVGSLSRKLISGGSLNPMVLGTQIRVLNQNQTNKTITDFCLTVDPAAAGCPFASGTGGYYTNNGNATYNSLQASLTKQVGSSSRWFGNSYFKLAYTYSHSIDNGSGKANNNSTVPAYQPRAFRGSSDYDLRHRISLGGSWELPVDQLWKSGPSRLTKGWNLYPILSWRTGFPINIGAAYPSFGDNDPGPSGAGDPGLAFAFLAPGVSRVQTVKPTAANDLTYFDAASFVSPDNPNYQFDPSVPCSQQVGKPEFPSLNCVLSSAAVRTYGGPRVGLTGLGRTNLDLSLAKTTSIFENLKAELRLEAFNVFNHTQFLDPVTDITDPDFGKIRDPFTFSPRIVQIALRLTF